MNRNTSIDKPILANIIFIRTLICLCVFAIISGALFMVMEKNHYQQLCDNDTNIINWAIDSIKEDILSHPGNTELSQECINQISALTAQYPFLVGQEIEFTYDGQPVIEDNPRVLLMIEGFWYVCEDQDVWEGLEEYQLNYLCPTKDLFETDDELNLSNTIKANKYYINRETLEFRPGIVNDMDYTPEDVSNWEVYESDSALSYMIVSNTEIVNSNYGRGVTTFFVDGEKHTIGHTNGAQIYNNNFMLFHGKSYIRTSSFILIITLIIAVMWIFLTYTHRKNIYDMFMYRSSLTSKLAHDLKTPLMAISSSAENLLVAPEGEKADNYKKQILDNVYYMNDMISSVLQLSKSESYRIIHDQEEVNVNLIINNCLNKLESKFEEKNITVDKNDLGEVNLKTDSSILSNALNCLIENASKYAIEGSTIYIKNDSQNIISIKNNFEGIIDNINELTKPFVRGSSHRGELGGSGLGLAIAKEDLSALSLKLDIKVIDNTFIVNVTK